MNQPAAPFLEGKPWLCHCLRTLGRVGWLVGVEVFRPLVADDSILIIFASSTPVAVCPCGRVVAWWPRSSTNSDIDRAKAAAQQVRRALRMKTSRQVAASEQVLSGSP